MKLLHWKDELCIYMGSTWFVLKSISGHKTNL